MRIALAAFLFAGTAAAADVNTLFNGDFSTASQLDGWGCQTTFYGSYQWSSEDAAGSGTSGSMQLTTSAYYDLIIMNLVPGQAFCTSTCMPTTPGAAYTLGGQMRVISLEFSASFTCAAYTDSSCSAPWPTTLASALTSPTTSWASMPFASGNLPSNAHSAACTATVNAPVGTVSVLFDNLFFLTSDVIFANGFD